VEAATTHDSDALLELIAAAGLPCVCLEQPPDPRFGFDSVLFDNFSGGYTATRYLIERGHRRIAHLQGDPHYASARQRRLGYERALADAGLAADPALVIGDSWDPPTVDLLVAQICDLADPPTAVFAANDNLAFRAIGVLHMSGRRVPEDMALVGFDDIPLAHEMVPPLTTMRIPLDEIGRRASSRLRRLTTERRPSTGEADLIVPELIRRATA
jgi:LacI family transcriptional regulator